MHREVERNYAGMGFTLMEPEDNTIASDYIANHWDNIFRDLSALLRGQVSDDDIQNIIQDVWLSIRKGETEGNGYNPEYGLSVAEFVYGRMKKYSKHRRYSGRYSEVSASKHTENGIEVISASSSADVEDMDAVQTAFALASTNDDIEAVEAEISLRQNIEFCMSFDELTGFSILSILRNIEIFGRSFNASLLSKLKEAVRIHDEFGETLKDIIEVSSSNRELFNQVLSTF